MLRLHVASELNCNSLFRLECENTPLKLTWFWKRAHSYNHTYFHIAVWKVTHFTGMPFFYWANLGNRDLDHYDEQTVIPNMILTFPRNSFSYWGILGHAFLCFEKHRLHNSDDASLKKKTRQESCSCSPQPYNCAGRGEGRWSTQMRSENICPLWFLHSSTYVSLVLVSSHTLHLITLRFQ